MLTLELEGLGACSYKSIADRSAIDGHDAQGLLEVLCGYLEFLSDFTVHKIA